MMKSWFVPVAARGILCARPCLSMPGLGLGSEPVDAVMYVSPNPSRSRRWLPLERRASIRRLPELLGFLPAGGEILVRADRGPYHLSKPIVLGDRGSSAPVTIRGVDPSGRGARPLIVGGRTALYSPETASTGRPAIAARHWCGSPLVRSPQIRTSGTGATCCAEPYAI